MATDHAISHAAIDAFEDAHPRACSMCGRTEHEVRVERDTGLCVECDEACSGPAIPGVMEEVARNRRLGLT